MIYILVYIAIGFGCYFFNINRLDKLKERINKDETLKNSKYKDLVNLKDLVLMASLIWPLAVVLYALGYE